MPLDALDAFDYTSEMIYPHLTSPSQTLAEQVALAKRIRMRPRDEVMLLAPTALGFPAAFAGFTTEQIEAVMRLGALSQKVALLSVFDTSEHLTTIDAVAQALGREMGESPDEIRYRLARIRLYVNDHRKTFIPISP